MVFARHSGRSVNGEGRTPYSKRMKASPRYILPAAAAAALSLFPAAALEGAAPADANMKLVQVQGTPQHEVKPYTFTDKESPHFIPTPAVAAPKNVILMIGDGMGHENLWAAWMLNGRKLNIFNLPYTGYSCTTSASHAVTDSAAGGTALACGRKTTNQYLGMAPDGTPMQNLAEFFRAQGKATGLVVTKDITDATPAAFYAHVADRTRRKLIAQDLVKAGFTVLYGGGKLTVSPEQQQTMAAAGTVAELTHPSNPPAASVRGMDYLSGYVGKALAELEKDPDGLFLMVEGSQIDHAAHSADVRETLLETLDFDRAVGVVLDWMKTHPDTLLVVTADHQTGGMLIKDGKPGESRVEAMLPTHSHNGFAVPVFAAGPGAARFSGVQDNTDICKKLRGE